MKIRRVTTRHSSYCSILLLGLLRVRPVLRYYHTGTLTTVKTEQFHHWLIERELTVAGGIAPN